MRSRIFYFLGGILFTLTNCTPETNIIPAVENSREYFPLKLGAYIDYQVDSIVLDDITGGNRKDSVRFQLREEIAGFHFSALGDSIYHIHRWRRTDGSENWVLKDVWTAQLDEGKMLRTEENLTFLKMILPLYKGQRWVTTSYIPPQTSVLIGTEHLEAYQYWESKVLEIDVAGQIGPFTFSDGQLMRIRQSDTDDGAMKRYVHEIYAREIGLIARTDTLLDSRCIDLGDFGPCLGVPWMEHADKGYILSQIMIGHN